MTGLNTHHHSSTSARAFRPGVFARQLALTALAAIASIPALHAAEPAKPAAPLGFWDSLAKGKFSGATRYRYEIYEQDSVPGATTVGAGQTTGTAIASTVRLALGYETASFHGFTAYAELEGVYALGEKENYRILSHPTQSNKARAIIADPLGTELGQAFVKWKIPSTEIQLLAGRENYFLNNGRFISFSGWRQNNQSIDLARASAKFGAFTANYAHLSKVRRVVGEAPSDGVLAMDSHVAHLDFAKPGVISASAYALNLDYALANQAGNDTATAGLRLTGPYKLNDTWSVVYTADYAHQTDYADNPLSVSLDYWCLELGLGYKAHKVFAGWTVLEGKNGATFRTPLAHPFNGWVEKFLNTPANGLEAVYLTVTGALPGVKGVTYTLTGYDYNSATGGTRYGSELDAALEWKAEPIHKNLTVGWRYGNYFADKFLTDSLRTSVYAAFKF